MYSQTRIYTVSCFFLLVSRVSIVGVGKGVRLMQNRYTANRGKILFFVGIFPIGSKGPELTWVHAFFIMWEGISILCVGETQN